MAKKMPQGPCPEPGCGNETKSRGYCNRHYIQHWRAGDLPPRLCGCGNPMPWPQSKWCADCHPACLDAACEQLAKSKGYCFRHYNLLLKDGAFGDGKVCVLSACSRPGVSRDGLCRGHYQRRVKYDLTIPELEQVVAGVACAICTEPAAYVDHCHARGVKRGFLCPACNSGLGFFRDDPARLAAAISYLASPPLEVRA